MAYARQIELQAYAGFNLIVGDNKQAVLVNNRGYPATPCTVVCILFQMVSLMRLGLNLSVCAAECVKRCCH
nr:NRDE family protein [Psychrobacter sp. PraFG1]UNK05339.1 NRDE family protein [Psychrobacter sp. PraFG1]